MQAMTFVVTYDGGKTDKIVCTAPDYMAFENYFDKPIGALESGRVTYLYWLAWHGLTRFKRVTADFDTWKDSCAAIEFVNDEDEIPPLESSQPIG
jgi:hypothetical protein